MITIKRILAAFVLAIVLFYVLKFVIQTVLALIIAIPLILVAVYVYYLYIAPKKVAKKDEIEEMEFEELD